MKERTKKELKQSIDNLICTSEWYHKELEKVNKNSAKLEMEVHKLSIALCKAEEMLKVKEELLKLKMIVIRDLQDDIEDSELEETTTIYRTEYKEVTQEKPRVDEIDLTDAIIEANQIMKDTK